MLERILIIPLKYYAYHCITDSYHYTLKHYEHRYIPEEFRGRFEVCDPKVDVKEIAKETGVDLRRDAGKKTKQHFANEEFKNLNGMQTQGAPYNKFSIRTSHFEV